MSIRDSIVGAIQSGQMAVGNALAGGGGAVVSGAGGATVVLEDLRRISKKNEQNTGRLTDVLSKMFAFDKAKFARLRDQSREEEKEKNNIEQAISSGQPVGDSGKSGTGLGLKGLAAIAGLALFAKGMGANTDILKLPQQLQSIRAMATFAKGVGTIGTLGFGPQILKNIKFAIQSTEFKIPKLFTSTNTLLGESIKNIKTSIRGPLLGAQMQMTLLGVSIKESFNAFKLAIMENKALKAIGGSIKGAMTSISATFEPVMNSLRSLFGGVGKEGGALSKIITPLKAIGKTIGKIFLPLTLILGVFDGVAGFMKEYEETGSIVDGIRGAVVGIVDGFIGTFVRLITDLVGMALSYLGLENLGASVIKFGEDITASFSEVIGGIVDIVTGIFTLDWERIKGGFGTLFSGAGNFFFTILTTPIDLAVNFIKDIFGFGNPDKPFSIKTFLFGGDGERGFFPGLWDMITGMFQLPDMSNLGAKLFDMSRIFKALAAGGVAAVKAILPGGLTPGEAFRESYNASMKASAPVIVEDPVGLKGTDIQSNTTENNIKTQTLNQGSTTTGTTVVYNDQSNKQVSNQNYAKSETYTGLLNTGIDPYFDRASYNGA